VVRLRELPRFAVAEFVRGDDVAALSQLLAQADAVVHLAGENRPGRTGFRSQLLLRSGSLKAPCLFLGYGFDAQRLGVGHAGGQCAGLAAR
jgi:hypothetical protein